MMVVDAEKRNNKYISAQQKNKQSVQGNEKLGYLYK